MTKVLRTSIALAALWVFFPASGAGQDAFWLDAPPSQWNNPGMAVTTLSQRNGLMNPDCVQRWRAPKLTRSTWPAP